MQTLLPVSRRTRLTLADGRMAARRRGAFEKVERRKNENCAVVLCNARHTGHEYLALVWGWETPVFQYQL